MVFFFFYGFLASTMTQGLLEDLLKVTIYLQYLTSHLNNTWDLMLLVLL
jgi:hypothetical protein